jgi:hypothetical protein
MELVECPQNGTKHHSPDWGSILKAQENAIGIYFMLRVLLVVLEKLHEGPPLRPSTSHRWFSSMDAKIRELKTDISSKIDRIEKTVSVEAQVKILKQTD